MPIGPNGEPLPYGPQGGQPSMWDNAGMGQGFPPQQPGGAPPPGGLPPQPGPPGPRGPVGISGPQKPMVPGATPAWPQGMTPEMMKALVKRAAMAYRQGPDDSLIPTGSEFDDMMPGDYA